jgi:YD repeat-containing protein
MNFRAVQGRTPRPRRSGGARAARLSALLAASVGFAGLAALPASAANNPGTGDSGFFTFRPADGVGGMQINVASGNALVRTRDLADGPLTYHVVVDRFYNSLDPDSYTIISPRWGFDVGPDAKLTVESNQDETVRGPSGYRIRFARQPDGSYAAPAGFDGSLVKTPSGWTLTRTSQNDEFGFDGSGNLTWTKDSELRDFTVQGTSAAGRTILSSYGTNSGRRVNLSYTTSGDYFVRLMDNPASGHHWYRYTGGRLSEYESPTGATTSYGYDSNGFLDEIVEPGGTSVELDVAASGKIHSITTTLPGGVPQTTSFVYTRRTYKSDVTAPDTTRRTYAYDDDWRVTRQYNPDEKPAVTASGTLWDLADGYTQGVAPISVTISATQPDGAGLVKLAVEKDGGPEVAQVAPPCTDTPFDRICPQSYAASTPADLSVLPEGQHALRAIARDDETNAAASDGWKVNIDRSAPAVPSDLVLGEPDENGMAFLSWVSDDPLLPGDVAGSGVQSCSVEVDGAAAVVVTSFDLEVDTTGKADVDVRVTCVDNVGNVSAPAEVTLEVPGNDPVAASWTDFPEGDPDSATLRATVTEPAIEYDGEEFPEEPVAMIPVQAVPVGSGPTVVVLTDETGVASMDLPSGAYEVSLAQQPSNTESVDIDAGSVTNVRLSTDPSAANRRATNRAESAWETLGRGVGCQVDAGISNIRVCNKLRGLRNRAEGVAKALFPASGIEDSDKRNSVQHSLFTSWGTRLMENQYDGELPASFAFDQAMKIENLDPDRELRFHRASFMDRNNNRVGMHYQQQWPHKNEAQLCAGIRTKAYSAKFMVFPAGSDRIPGWPAAAVQTRLGYILKNGNPLSAAQLGQSSPCAWALKRHG